MPTNVGILGERDQGQDVRTNNGKLYIFIQFNLNIYIYLLSSHCRLSSCQYSQKLIRTSRLR